MLPKVESLTVEFKSDQACYSDADLVSAVVAMANGLGGDLYLGIEDDGTVTGLHRKHLGKVNGLAALIYNSTNPNLTVQTKDIEVNDLHVAKIEVPRAPKIIMTSKGTCIRRRLDSKGKPEVVPFNPQDQLSHLADLQVLDLSAQPVPNTTVDDLSAFERARLREYIVKYNGDHSLLELDDDELDGALGLVTKVDGRVVPTLTGLLILGKESVLRRAVPTHEIAFQVLDGEEVRMNEFLRKPLLAAMSEIETLVKPLNIEKEFLDGMFRVAVPRIDPRAFREAVLNAVTHRDYTKHGATHIQFFEEELKISNPGGFVDGVSLNNLLTTPPRPRNIALADVLKRIGLVERTGRGIDLIYRGLLRYGRASPDYRESTSTSVSLTMSLSDVDEIFFKQVLIEEDRLGKALPIDTLIILDAIRHQKRLTLAELAHIVQKNLDRVRPSVETMVECGLLTIEGKKPVRYKLAPSLYELLDKKAEQIRSQQIAETERPFAIKAYCRQYGSITRKQAGELCRISLPSAAKLLSKMQENGELEMKGKPPRSYYVQKTK